MDYFVPASPVVVVAVAAVVTVAVAVAVSETLGITTTRTTRTLTSNTNHTRNGVATKYSSLYSSFLYSRCIRRKIFIPVLLMLVLVRVVLHLMYSSTTILINNPIQTKSKAEATTPSIVEEVIPTNVQKRKEIENNKFRPTNTKYDVNTNNPLIRSNIGKTKTVAEDIEIELEHLKNITFHIPPDKFILLQQQQQQQNANNLSILNTTDSSLSLSLLLLNNTLYALHRIAIHEAIGLSSTVSDEQLFSYRYYDTYTTNTTTTNNNNDDDGTTIQFYLPTIGYRQCLGHTNFDYKNFHNKFSTNNVLYIGNNNQCIQYSSVQGKCDYLSLTSILLQPQKSIGTVVVVNEQQQQSQFQSQSVGTITLDQIVTNFITITDHFCTSSVVICGIQSTFLCGVLGMYVRKIVYIVQEEYDTWPQWIKNNQSYTFMILTKNSTTTERQEANHRRNLLVSVTNSFTTQITLPVIAKSRIRSQLLDNHRILFERHTIRTTHPALLQYNGLVVKQNNIDDDSLTKSSSSYGNDTGFNIFLYSHSAQCDNITRSNQVFVMGNVGDTFGSFLANYVIHHIVPGMDYHVFCTSDFQNRKGKRIKDPRTGLFRLQPTIPFVVPKPPITHHLTFAFVGSIVGPTLASLKVYNDIDLNNTSRIKYQKVLLGPGLIDNAATQLQQYPTRSYYPNNLHTLGVRGSLTRDILLHKYNVNAEVVGDPGLFLYPVVQSLIDTVRNSTTTNTTTSTMTRELCFVQHEVEIHWYNENMPKYSNITIRAGGWGSGGNFTEIISFLVTCQHVVSSSLHGIIFAHALSIPAMPIHVTDQLLGNDFKFYDYYYGINITNFPGRYNVKDRGMPQSISQWIHTLRTEYEQPTFPFNPLISQQRLLQIFQSIYSR